MPNLQELINAEIIKESNRKNEIIISARNMFILNVGKDVYDAIMNEKGEWVYLSDNSVLLKFMFNGVSMSIEMSRRGSESLWDGYINSKIINSRTQLLYMINDAVKDVLE